MTTEQIDFLSGFCAGKIVLWIGDDDRDAVERLSKVSSFIVICLDSRPNQYDLDNVAVCLGNCDELLSLFSPRTFGAVYVDGESRRFSARRDVNQAWRVVGRHGVIVCNGYREITSVTEAIDTLSMTEKVEVELGLLAVVTKDY